MIKLPTPQELGLPDKFEKLRPNQEAALELLLTYRHLRIKSLCMPTGSGKTLVYVMYALITREPTCFVTHTLGLQDQISGEYASIGMVDLRGRGQYLCGLMDEYSCEEGFAAKCPYKGTIACPEAAASMRAAISPLVVTNYSKWTYAKKYGVGMSHFTQVVFDEGHFAPKAIAAVMQVTLHHREIEEVLGLTFPGYPDFNEVINWKPWAVRARTVAEEHRLKYQSKIQNSSNPKPAWVKEVTHMKNLIRRLGTLSTASPSNWVADEVEAGFQFDPISPAKYGEAMLLMNTPSVIFISATMTTKTMAMTGIGKAGQKPIEGGIVCDKYVFVEYDSDFDPKDCPIYYIPTQRVDNKHPDRRMLWMRLDQFLARRQDRKGIVGTISHARREEIMISSSYQSKMIFNERGEPAAQIVEDYKKAGPGTILVSPSIGTGYDFPGSLCEFIFLCKVPMEPPSKIVKAREHLDKEYRGYTALQAMEQHFGRGARFRGDPCEGVIPDDNLMDWFMRSFGHLATRTFHKRFKVLDKVPSPPPKYVEPIRVKNVR